MKIWYHLAMLGNGVQMRDLVRRGALAIPLFAFFALPLCACIGFTGFLPEPARADRIREATELEHKRCKSQAVDPRVYSADDVESVAPLYTFVPTSGSNREARLRGAEVRLRPLPGLTPELLTYELSCRSAQLVLGRVQEGENEPYWLPDGWVKIGVSSDDGDFVVAIEGEDLPESKEILARAQAFAASAKH
jgi:hypothetical protein